MCWTSELILGRYGDSVVGIDAFRRLLDSYENALRTLMRHSRVIAAHSSLPPFPSQKPITPEYEPLRFSDPTRLLYQCQGWNFFIYLFLLFNLIYCCTWTDAFTSDFYYSRVQCDVTVTEFWHASETSHNSSDLIWYHDLLHYIETLYHVSSVRKISISLHLSFGPFWSI